LAGTSQSQLIKHFTDKQGILEAVFEHSWEQINPAVQLATESIVAARDKLKILTDMILGEELIRFACSKIWPLGRLRHHNLSDDCRAGGDSCLDHNQSQKGLHCVGADAHPIRNLFAAQALHQISQRFFLALREIKLLGDLRQGDESEGASFEKDGYAGVSGVIGLRIHKERPAKIMSPA